MNIDKKQFFTGVAAGVAVVVIAFFLNKWFVKKYAKANGETSSYVGHESVGFI